MNQENSCQPLCTNREFYRALMNLLEQNKDIKRSLEEYLRALLGLSKQYAGQPYLVPSEFFHLLSAAFNASPVTFEESWRTAAKPDCIPKMGDRASYTDFQDTLIEQIVDLREMKEAGTLENKWRYMGVESPRGSSWYNFDTDTYLECGMVGSFGGWDPENESRRMPLSGPVAVNENDKIEDADPQDLLQPVEPIKPMETLNWGDLLDFIKCGQLYE